MTARALILLSLLGPLALAVYEPTWSSLDTRPLPVWYDEAKFGVLVHWGVYSVPSFESEWFWYHWKTLNYSADIRFMKDNFPPHFTYQDFARDFRPTLFDPDFWADLIKASGAKYVVLTSKHHEGFTLWPSNRSFSWNVKDLGPNRDLVGALASSVRARSSVRFGLYYSLYEWYNPLYLMNQASDFRSQTFVQQKVIPELKDIVNTYRPEVVWSDGDWGANYSYWDSEHFLSWLYNESPVRETVVVNDRWGIGTMCQHGSFFTCDDNYEPGVLQAHKWENCMSIDKHSWGYRRTMVLQDLLTIEDILESLITTISCGGNLLLNVGPTPDGRIIPVFEERLRQVGRWLGVNGEAVYSSSPWTYQNDTLTPNLWYTTNTGSGAVYAFVLNYPSDYHLTLGAPTTIPLTKISLLGLDKQLAWTATGSQGLNLTLPYLAPGTLQWAWVLKLEDVR